MPRLILCLLLACLARPAWAVELEPLQHIRDAAESYVSARLGGVAAASAGTLDPRLRLPACGGPLQAMAPTPNNNSPWSVAVHCAGPAIWTLYVPVHASERRTVVVATRPLPPGQPVPADALAVQERDVAALPNGYLARAEDVAGKILRRPVAMGAALTPDMIGASASVHRGQQVSLVSGSGGFFVRANGRVLSDAADGERVKAENLDSHRIVEGVVRDSETVEVGL